MGRFSGPITNMKKSGGLRQWFQGLPMGKEPDLVEYFNDFIASKDFVAADWVVTETDSGATEAIAADELNGALLITNTAGAADLVQIQGAEETWKMSLGKQLWFETKLKFSEASAIGLFVGLSTTDTTPLTTTDSVGFRKAAATALVHTVTEDNTTETTSAGVHTLVAATYVTLGFHWDGVSSVRFFVNRSLVATHSTNIEQTNKLALVINQTNGEAVAKTTTIDYIYCAQER